MNQCTHEDFIKKLDLKFPDRSYEIISEYDHNTIPLLIKDKYGICEIPPNALLQRSNPSVKTAINKTEYTVNKFIEQWGDTFDYSKFIYKGARAKSTILCRVHGAFEQDANMHLSGRCGCMKCANENIGIRLRSNTKEFIEKAVLKYGSEKFKFDKTTYVSATEYVTITCDLHGDFEETPNRFLNGQICKKCSYKESTTNYHILKKRRKNSVLYIIECYNEEERFIKIGVTSRNINARFSDNSEMPYNYKILREFRYANMKAVDALETEFLRFTKTATYNPNLKFSGYTEARLLNIKDPLLGMFDVYTDNLYYLAFVNFAAAYDNLFDEEVLKCGDYSKIEIDSVMKGYEIYKKITNEL